jgi:hypothetical protein
MFIILVFGGFYHMAFNPAIANVAGFAAELAAAVAKKGEATVTHNAPKLQTPPVPKRVLVAPPKDTFGSPKPKAEVKAESGATKPPPVPKRPQRQDTLTVSAQESPKQKAAVHAPDAGDVVTVSSPKTTKTPPPLPPRKVKTAENTTQAEVSETPPPRPARPGLDKTPPVSSRNLPKDVPTIGPSKQETPASQPSLTQRQADADKLFLERVEQWKKVNPNQPFPVDVKSVEARVKLNKEIEDYDQQIKKLAEESAAIKALAKESAASKGERAGQYDALLDAQKQHLEEHNQALKFKLNKANTEALMPQAKSAPKSSGTTAASVAEKPKSKGRMFTRFFSGTRKSTSPVTTDEAQLVSASSDDEFKAVLAEGQKIVKASKEAERRVNQETAQLHKSQAAVTEKLTQPLKPRTAAEEAEFEADFAALREEVSPKAAPPVPPRKAAPNAASTGATGASKPKPLTPSQKFQLAQEQAKSLNTLQKELGTTNGLRDLQKTAIARRDYAEVNKLRDQARDYNELSNARAKAVEEAAKVNDLEKVKRLNAFELNLNRLSEFKDELEVEQLL